MTKPSVLTGSIAAITLLALSACTAPPLPDYAAQNQPVIDALLAGWNAGNLDGLAQGVASNYRRVSSGGLNTEGLDGLKKVMSDLRTAYPDIKITVDEIHHMQGLSVARWTFTGTHTGPGDVPPTGRSVKVSGLTQARFEGGKLVEEIVAFDALDWYQQLGYTLAPPATAVPVAPAATK